MTRREAVPTKLPSVAVKRMSVKNPNIFSMVGPTNMFVGSCLSYVMSWSPSATPRIGSTSIVQSTSNRVGSLRCSIRTSLPTGISEKRENVRLRSSRYGPPCASEMYSPDTPANVESSRKNARPRGNRHGGRELPLPIIATLLSIPSRPMAQEFGSAYCSRSVVELHPEKVAPRRLMPACCWLNVGRDAVSFPRDRNIKIIGGTSWLCDVTELASATQTTMEVFVF